MGCFLTCTKRDFNQIRQDFRQPRIKSAGALKTHAHPGHARTLGSPPSFEQTRAFEQWKQEEIKRQTARLKDKEEILKQQKAESEARKAKFRDEMKARTRHERGDWGEHALKQEMRRQYGHQVIMEHEGKSTARGYDGVTIAVHNGQVSVHIWEVKNYSANDKGKRGQFDDISAWTDRRDVPNQHKLIENAKAKIDDPNVLSEVIRCIENNENICWHVRFGPDTDVKISTLETAKSNSDWLDVKQYSDRDMLDALSTGK